MNNTVDGMQQAVNQDMFTLNGLISLTRQWAYARNIIEGSTSQAQFCKLVEELGELAIGLNKNIPAKVQDGVGDMLVVLIILCEQQNISLKQCLSMSYNEIKDRKGKMVDGIFIKENDQDINKSLEPTLKNGVVPVAIIKTNEDYGIHDLDIGTPVKPIPVDLK